MSIKLQLARSYIRNGWSVFPLNKRTKDQPAVKWGEYRERYATDGELVEWFEKNDYEIAIATGKLSNLTVLDADGVVGIQDVIRLGLSSPATVLTGGGGRQLYYQWSGETNKWTSKDHQGLDSRGEGGYVVAAGSTHPNGNKYHWAGGTVPSSKSLSAWPSGLLENPKPVVVGTQVIQPVIEPWLVQAMKGAGTGDRHRLLVKLACYLIPRHNYDYVKQNLLDWNLKNNPPLADAEVVKQLDDLVKRFKTGQYKSKYVPPKQEFTHEPTGTATAVITRPTVSLDIQSTKGIQAYFDEQLAGGTTPLPELPTGFTCLDKTTWGIKRGNLYIVGARPGVGKTTYAINLASTLCRAGKRVLFFSTEMSPQELFDKFAASEGEIPASNITTRNFTQDDRDKLTKFIPQFQAHDLHIVNLFKPSIEEVKEAVERIQPDVLIFDHIQHIKEGDASEYASISRFIKDLKGLARETNIGVVVNSQLSRTSTLDNRMPELQDLKGCGTLEEEASVVILLHDAQRKGDRSILFRVAKNRFGKCGDTTLMFKELITRFEDTQVEVA